MAAAASDGGSAMASRSGYGVIQEKSKGIGHVFEEAKGRADPKRHKPQEDLVDEA